MSKENFAQFMQQVKLDPSLQQKLVAAPDKEQATIHPSFVTLGLIAWAKHS